MLSDPEKEKGKEGRGRRMCLRQLFGGISCFYHAVEIFRVFISTESMNYNYVGEEENSLLLFFLCQD